MLDVVEWDPVALKCEREEDLIHGFYSSHFKSSHLYLDLSHRDPERQYAGGDMSVRVPPQIGLVD